MILLRLAGQFAQRRMVRTAEAHLDAAAAAGTQQKLLGDGVGVGVVIVQVFLDAGNQPVYLLIVIHLNQKLNVCRVLPFRRVYKQKAQTAAADE